jgi:hypothetical protein
MTSLRLEPEIAAALRELATRRGTTVSDLLREGALLLLREEARQHESVVSFRVFVDTRLDTRTDMSTGNRATVPTGTG